MLYKIFIYLLESREKKMINLTNNDFLMFHQFVFVVVVDNLSINCTLFKCTFLMLMLYVIIFRENAKMLCLFIKKIYLTTKKPATQI